MAGLAQSLLQHHRYCDRCFASAIAAAAASDWDTFARQLAALEHALERHIAFEESELFPAFEAASGLRQGPTEVMRAEHAEMRELLAALGAAQPGIDPQGCRAELEHLRAMLQEHNVKEEAVLYPACDQMLGARTDLLAGAQALNDRAGAPDRECAPDVPRP
ncbi:MAG: hemerythrin domain-containing protein [Burkholderiales bacterium]